MDIYLSPYPQLQMSTQQNDQFMEALMEAVGDEKWETEEERAKRIEDILNNLYT